MRNSQVYGDQVTLHAMSEICNVQILVVSEIDHGTALIHPAGQNILSSDIPLIILGHFPEGIGEHHVSLGYDHQSVRTIIKNSPQIYVESHYEDQNHSDRDNAPEESVHDIVDDRNRSEDDSMQNTNDDQHENAPDEYMHKTNEHQDLSECDRGDNVVFRSGCGWSLPFEVAAAIITLSAITDISSRQRLRCVSKVFKNVVDHVCKNVEIPRIHIREDLVRRLKISNTFNTKSIISVRKILSHAGWDSGIAINIKSFLQNPHWMNAWFEIERDNDVIWYIVNRVFWKRYIDNMFTSLCFITLVFLSHISWQLYSMLLEKRYHVKHYVIFYRGDI